MTGDVSRGARAGAWRRFGILGAAAALGAADAPRPPVDLPADTLLLLVAPWCAPCWGELRRLDALADAAAPLGVRVVMMEDGPRARAMLREVPPARQWLPDERVRAALWARTPALPFSLATDRHGRICAERGGGLDVGKARALARDCTGGAD